MAESAFGALKTGKKKGFFGRPPNETVPEPATPLQTVLTEVSRRLKILEERHENSRKRIGFIEQNIQESHKKLAEEIKASKWEIQEINKSVKDIEKKIFLLVKEVKLSASKEDVEILKKYLHFWEPVTFVTRTQVEKIVKEMLEELGIYGK